MPEGSFEYASLHSLPLILLLAILSPVHAQGQEFTYDALTVDQGLSQSSVWSIIQDHKGFLWFGTSDGLNRYDGYSFRVFRHDAKDSSSISQNTVDVLYEDRAHDIWVGTTAGLERYRRRPEGFDHVAPNAGTFLASRINSILEDRSGTFWFGTMKGLVLRSQSGEIIKEVASDEFQPRGLPAPGIVVLFEDDEGCVWVTNRSSLFRCDPKTWRIDPLKPNGRDPDISPLCGFRDHEGIYWIGTVGNGVWSFDSGKNRWHHYVQNSLDSRSLYDSTITTICEDNTGRLWFGGANNGLFFLDRVTGEFHPFKPMPGGRKNARYEGVRSIFRDRSGLLWVGYDGAGVVKVNPYPNKFRHILLPRSDAGATGDNFFKALIVDHLGDVWLGTYDQGISVFRRKTGLVKRYRHSSDPRSLSGNTVFALLEDRRGNVWVGTRQGLDEFDRQNGHFIHHDLSVFWPGTVRDRIVTALCEDSTGTVWCGTTSGLLRFSQPRVRMELVFSTKGMSGLPVSPAINVIVPAPDGGLWVGTLGAGLLRVNRNGVIERRFVHIPGSSNSISHNSVKTILVDHDGILWIGTEEGLNRYDAQFDRWKNYRTFDGLPNDFIYGLLMDAKQNLWISTNRGLSRMGTTDPERPTFRNYTPDDGLQSFEFNTNCYFKMDDGHMLFGGVNGFNIFHPDSVFDNAIIPAVAITGFKKFDLPIDLDADPAALTEVRLEPFESVFSLEFAALEYTNPELNRYAYLMEGFDKDWVYSGPRREARYTNLDPGMYVFRVKGSNNDGVWNEKGTSISVVIVPPLWRTWWFIGCLALVIATAFGAGVRYASTRKLRKKVEQLEHEKALQDERLKTRERIARDLHDDLASTVGSAGLFIESAKMQMPGAPTQAREFLDKTSSLLTEAEETMSDIVWSVSPRHDSLESLLTRIQLLAGDLCKAHRIQCEFDASRAQVVHSLGEEDRRALYLIMKEAISNAASHAGARVIRVAAWIENDILHMTVVDDGKGMEGERAHQPPTKRGHGLRNMRKRAEEINAVFSITSTPGNGTIVSLSKGMMQKGH